MDLCIFSVERTVGSLSWLPELELLNGWQGWPRDRRWITRPTWVAGEACSESWYRIHLLKWRSPIRWWCLRASNSLQADRPRCDCASPLDLGWYPSLHISGPWVLFLFLSPWRASPCRRNITFKKSNYYFNFSTMKNRCKSFFATKIWGLFLSYFISNERTFVLVVT